MEVLLRAKHWQLFVYITLAGFLSILTITYNPDLTVILNVTGTVLYFFIPVVLGHSLNEYLPKSVGLNYGLFMFNSFVFMLSYPLTMLLSDGQGMEFTGLAAIPAFYVFYAYLNMLAFPMKLLTSIELDREATFREYLLDFFLLLFFPIGVWFLQPRINRAVQKANLTREKETPVANNQ